MKLEWIEDSERLRSTNGRWLIVPHPTNHTGDEWWILHDLAHPGWTKVNPGWLVNSKIAAAWRNKHKEVRP